MKSAIDWNEIVPKLPKNKREDLYLEAVTILSAAPAEAPRAAPFPRVVMRVPKKGNGKTHRKDPHAGERKWRTGVHAGEVLAAPGNHYKIHKTKRNVPSVGKVGKLWQNLMACKKDVISYEGFASLCHGVDLPASATCSQLWSRRLIDLVPEPPKGEPSATPEKKVAFAE